MLVSRSAPAAIDHDQANFVTAEFSRVCQDPVDGIYICPLLNNILEWRGFIMVRAGCYSGGTFRFTLILPQGFPQSIQLPIVIFDSFLFHPYIDPATRELCLQSCFPGGVWRRDQHKVVNILQYLQEAFAVLTENFPLDNRSIVNKQAATLFMKDFDNYRLRAEELVSLSRHTVYDTPEDCWDPHLIVFTPWESSKMEPVRRQLLGKTGPPTDSSSRTASDFSSRATSNGAEADDERVSTGSGHSFEEINLVDRKDSLRDQFVEIGENRPLQDQFVEVEKENSLQDHSENEEKHSPRDHFLEVENNSPREQLSEVERNTSPQNQHSEDLSSVDLESCPTSGRIDKIEEDPEEAIEKGFDLLNFDEGPEDKFEPEEDANELNHDENPKDRTELEEYSHELSEIPTRTVSFKLGCTSSSSGTEYPDELEPHSMHLKSPLCNAVPVEPISESENDAFLDEAFAETPRGADTRSVSVFNNVLQ
ncbi:hypothetical protein FO519_002965 [Halicephalobus sp. NKZ332]|nr:hypothetical protein FO519_002965 [Halicephalobus sp. NKZ332]